MEDTFSCIYFLTSILKVLHLQSYYGHITVTNFLLSILLISGDVERNPGPNFVSKESFSICHWNLISITAHNYAKILLLKLYIAVYGFDIICLSETFFDSKTLSDDDNLDISGYNLVRSDLLSNSKRGGVCIYYKKILPIRIINVNSFNEYIRLELNVGERLCRFYRFPSQMQD